MPENQPAYYHICLKNYRSAFYKLLAVLWIVTESLLPRSIYAQNIGNWTFNNILTGTPGPLNTISNADFSASVPIHAFNGGTEYYGENGWPAGALNTSMYMQFSLTPTAGYQLDINSIVLTIRRSNTGSPAGSGPTSWSLRSSLDGFTSDIASGSMTLTYANYSVTPGSSFLNIYSTVTFRLYGYNATVGSGGNSRLVADNITVKGLGYLLPVTLGAFNAAIIQDAVNLSYTVYNTGQGSQYVLERSTDGIHFNAVNTTIEVTDAPEKKYVFTDALQALADAASLYYRIHLVNNSGMNIYSFTLRVKNDMHTAPLKMFIRNNQLYISGVLTDGGVYTADVYTVSGQAVSHTIFTAASGYNSYIFPLSKPMPATCIIHVTNGRAYSASAMSYNQ